MPAPSIPATLPAIAPRPGPGPTPGGSSSSFSATTSRVGHSPSNGPSPGASASQQQQHYSHPAASTSTAPAPASTMASAPASASSSTRATPVPHGSATGTTATGSAPPTKRKRRNKVDSACRFCRKSHMQCSGERPCARCIKREIAHLCTDAPAPAPAPTSTSAAPAPAASGNAQQGDGIVPKVESPSAPGQGGGTASGYSTGLGDGSSMINTLGLDFQANRQHSGSPHFGQQQQQQQRRRLSQSQSQPFGGRSSASPGTATTAVAGPTNAPNSTSQQFAQLLAAGSNEQQQQGSPYHSASNNLHGLGTAASPGTVGASAAPNGAGLYASEFNMAMLDLANDGLGSMFGLETSSLSSNGDGEFHGLGLSEFLASLDAPMFTSNPGAFGTSSEGQQQQNTLASTLADASAAAAAGGPRGSGAQSTSDLVINMNDTGLNESSEAAKDKAQAGKRSFGPSVPGSPVNKTERFLLTAADQKDGSRSDRLAKVIHAKFEAGLLRPYNHVAGYTRLMKWMADNMSANSRQRTLHTLSEFRPTFRAIASGLTDLDLVFIEEAFERLLLDYDRVFSSMGIPSCLWRRTGEIYKGNKEFAALVGVPIEDLQGGKLAIYELMAEESAVNYWEKYGNIAFDVGQKAVLTSCVLINQSILSRKRKKAGADKRKVPEDAMVNACFSFTIRRDSYGIPSMIVGNFIKL